MGGLSELYHKYVTRVHKRLNISTFCIHTEYLACFPLISEGLVFISLQVYSVSVRLLIVIGFLKLSIRFIVLSQTILWKVAFFSIVKKDRQF